MHIHVPCKKYAKAASNMLGPKLVPLIRFIRASRLALTQIIRIFNHKVIELSKSVTHFCLRIMDMSVKQ